MKDMSTRKYQAILAAVFVLSWLLLSIITDSIGVFIVTDQYAMELENIFDLVNFWQSIAVTLMIREEIRARFMEDGEDMRPKVRLTFFVLTTSYFAALVLTIFFRSIGLSGMPLLALPCFAYSTFFLVFLLRFPRKSHD